MSDNLAELIVDIFTPLKGQTFSIHYGGEQPLKAELVDAVPMSEEFRRPGVRHPFSLIFRGGDSRSYLMQHMYKVEHETLGTLEIFLVPIGPDATGQMCYEAVFN